MTKLADICYVLAVAMTAACGGSGNAGEPGPDGGSSSDARGPGGSDAHPTVGVGTVLFARDYSAKESDIDAAFFAHAPSCTQQTIAGCTVTTCGGSDTPVDTGKLTLDWPSASSPETLTQGPDGFYSFQLTGLDLWAPADSLTADSSGGTVPAFSGAVNLPGTMDAMTDYLPSYLQRGGAVRLFAMRIGGAQAPAVIAFTQGATTVSCPFPSAAAGSYEFDISGDAIAALTAGSQATMSWYEVNETNVVAGDYSITLRAVDAAMSPLAFDVY